MMLTGKMVKIDLSFKAPKRVLMSGSRPFLATLGVMNEWGHVIGLYYITGHYELTGLPKHACKRGSSALEGWHRWFRDIAATNASPELLDMISAGAPRTGS